MSTDVVIDKEFSTLLAPLTREERDGLEREIKADGCREALVVWRENGKLILLDGHNRLDICRKHSLTYRTTEKAKIKSRDDARNFIIVNQLSRRNLTEEQKSFLRGQQYIAEKMGQHRPEKRPQNGAVNTGRTRERLAKQHNVSRNTIERDADFAAAVDVVAKNTGEETRNAILTGELKLPKQEVVKLATLPAEKQVEAVAAGRDAIKQAVAQADRTPSVAANGKTPVGVIRANEAIDCLKRIPKNDPLRKRGFQVVTDWIRHNK